jgi:predicted transcriptional regulator
MTERERFTTTLDGELLRKIKILAINRRCSTNILIEEAIADILEKYEKEPPSIMASRSVEISQPAVHEPSAPYNPKPEK